MIVKYDWLTKRVGNSESRSVESAEEQQLYETREQQQLIIHS